jgi:hypothetical protein
MITILTTKLLGVHHSRFITSSSRSRRSKCRIQWNARASSSSSSIINHTMPVSRTIVQLRSITTSALPWYSISFILIRNNNNNNSSITFRWLNHIVNHCSFNNGISNKNIKALDFRHPSVRFFHSHNLFPSRLDILDYCNIMRLRCEGMLQRTLTLLLQLPWQQHKSRLEGLLPPK